jgi:4'-phosphopantetheinyl transferase
MIQASALGGARPPASAAEVHVWRVALDEDGWPPVDRLSHEERERAARLRRPEAARRWAAARWALRGVLGQYLDAPAAGIGLRRGAHGKPKLVDPATSLRFNLSHSGDLALIAVAREREVGIDVEWIDLRRDVLALAPHALDDAEAATVRAATPHARSAVFHAAWVRREAIAKCLGTGLAAPAPKATVTVSALDAGPDFAAALAIAGGRLGPLRHFVVTPRLECLRPASRGATAGRGRR